MKKRRPPITVLYAAPGFFRPGRDDGEREDEKKPYPNNYEENDAPKQPERDPDTMQAIYAVPDSMLQQDAVKPPAEAFMCVYAGPDWFAAHNSMNDVYAGPVPQEEPEEPEDEPNETPEEHEETDEERHARLLKEFSENPPAVCGLVQAPPDRMDPNGAGLAGMMNIGTSTPKYCSECGTKTKPGDKFCRECGSRLIR